MICAKISRVVFIQLADVLVASNTRLIESEEMLSDCKYAGCENLMIATVC